MYRQVLGVFPTHSDTVHLMGVLFLQQGNGSAAIEWIQRAIALNPQVAVYYCNLGEAFRRTGNDAPAIAAYHRALELDIRMTDAHANLGVCLRDMGRPADALQAWLAGLRVMPENATLWWHAGNGYLGMRQFDEAIAAFRKAISLWPAEAFVSVAQTNMAHALKDSARLDEAIAAYREALRLAPADSWIHSNLIMGLQFDPAMTNEAMARELAEWSRRHAAVATVAPHENNRDPERRLRIGYVSGDFWDHAVGRNIFPLFKHHDKQAVELFAYSTGGREDSLTPEFKAWAEGWRDIAGVADEEVVRMIRADRIDVLVDLAVHSEGGARLKVFAQKPAPVQGTFAGYPGSTGLRAMDFRLTDRFLEPPEMPLPFVEEPMRLPSFWCFEPLRDAVEVSPLPAAHQGFVTFGCLNNFCKVHEVVLRLWGRVMRRVAESRLLLLAPVGRARQWAAGILAAEGVAGGRISWVDFLPRGEYLRMFQQFDISLDTFPYTGHTTSLESWWMGVPVVTLVGQTVVGRGGLSQCMNLGMGELVGRTAEEFVEIAVRLAGDLRRLADMRATARQRMEKSALMDGVGFARAIEAAYRQQWRRWCGQGV